MDGPSDATFDAVCRLAVRLVNAPLALVSFVGPDRQVYKAAAGPMTPAPGSLSGAQVHTFCQHVVAHDEAVAVDDTTQPPPALAGVAAPGIGAYLGVPLHGPDGHALGTLCVVDSVARSWSAADREALAELAPLVTRSIEFRGTAARLDQEARARADAQALADAALNALTDAFFVLGLDGRLRQWNAGLRTATGLDDTALADLDVRALAAPEDVPRLQDAIRQALTAGSATLQAAVLGPEGARATHEFSISRMVDGAGEVVGACATGRDVSVRLETETALRLSESRYRGLVDATPDLFLRLTRDGCYLDVRAPDPAHLVLDEDCIVGATVAESIPEPLASIILAAVGRALDTGERQQLEYALTPSDGQERRYEARLVPVGADEVQAVIRDVTDRHEAARALRESEVRFRSFVEATNQVVWMADATGEVTELSEAWARFTGQAPDQIAGWGWADALHPDDARRVIEEWSGAIAARTHYEVEYLSLIHI